MRRLGWACWLALGAPVACKEPAPTSDAATSVAVPSAAPSASVAAAPAPSTAPAPSAGAPQPKLSAVLEDGKLGKLSFERGAWLGELERTPPARVLVTLATKDQPLGPRARAAHFRIAELVAPGVVAPTALRALSVAELSHAADSPTRKRLEKQARVLGNGSVEVALTLAPAPTLTRVELTRLGEDAPAQGWETLLGAREPIPEAQQLGLAQYQALLVIDYVSGNAARISVFRHAKTGRLTATEGNEAFSPVPKEGGQNDALTRLSRHMTYSKSLEERLGKLEREALERALGWGDPPTLLVTPKQVEECIERARSVRRLIAERVKQRGADKALALP
ncbi:MAG: hypothetical protein IPM35_29290 [Myxococcales bacterium]|nr:hypothetical protein [Myxococcales bacterium]